MTDTISLSSRPQAVRRYWRQTTGRLLLSGLLLLSATSALAQPPPPPAAPGVTVSRSWYLEAVIVAGMAGLALFVVCRSSRRN